MNDTSLLDVEHLHVDLAGRHRGADPRPVIHDVTLRIAAGESVGLVGESGSGKSMTAKAVMRLLPRGAATTGRIAFEGRSVLELDRRQLSSYRSHDVSMIYQDPRAHVNPLRTVGDFLVEGVVATGAMSSSDAVSKACELLHEVGVGDAERRMSQYPHQLSGGLLQRMMIVMALLSGPKLVLADEPTTALDVTVQSEVMAILADEIRDRGLGLLFITHNLDLAAAVTDTIAVMYAGVIVESAASADLYRHPRHPYTAGLLASRPSITRVDRLLTIPGRPISAFEAGPGCVFATRCAFATDVCHADRPRLREVDGHKVACHRTEEISQQLAQEVQTA